MSDRAEIQLVDLIVGLTVLLPILALAPFWTRFTTMVTSRSDPFTALILALAVPLLLISFLVSISVSARRR